MFIHNFKYMLKKLFNDKILIFWTFAFPLILGTFFSLAFSNIEEGEKLAIIDIAVVKNEKYNNSPIWQEAIKTLSDKKNTERLFNTKYVSLEKAKELLNDEEITGYILLEDSPKVVVMTSGINETIIKQVTEEITEQETIMNNITNIKINEQLKNNQVRIENPDIFYASIYKEIAELTENSKANIKDVSSNNLSYTMIEFYTLIAMTCLYGGILGMVAINQCLANMSSNGKRVAVSPASKSKLVISSALASYLIQLLGVFLLFIYTIFALKVDYGNNLFYVIILTLTGCLAGLSLGIALGSLIKSNENVKTGIIIAVTMFGCFLSGMMGITMKYIIDKNIPILNKINPASMITDGFYSLYYYNTYERFFFNVASLIIFSFILLLLASLSLRRQKYDSI